jgi:hypothetical protein
MELKSPLSRSGSCEKATVTVLPPVGKGMAAVPLAAQVTAVGATGTTVVGTTGTEVAGATVAGVGPQDARSMLAMTINETTKNIERFTISPLEIVKKKVGMGINIDILYSRLKTSFQ